MVISEPNVIEIALPIMNEAVLPHVWLTSVPSVRVMLSTVTF
ncbi:hypothetical protein BAL199_01324 [alpha proteobacterium BAL199]|nr:hypothetical protein BAL199_01324 [alpha proteobacterium BAL199]